MNHVSLTTKLKFYVTSSRKLDSSRLKFYTRMHNGLQKFIAFGIAICSVVVKINKYEEIETP
jgi:hypothetical protein